MPGARVLGTGGDGVAAHHAAGVGHRAAATLPVRGGVEPCYGRRRLAAGAGPAGHGAGDEHAGTRCRAGHGAEG
jgi:hypothetical protein